MLEWMGELDCCDYYSTCGAKKYHKSPIAKFYNQNDHFHSVLNNAKNDFFVTKSKKVAQRKCFFLCF